MKMMALSKKDHVKKKFAKSTIHWEGKYLCDCKVRKYRLWLGLKKYGFYEVD